MEYDYDVIIVGAGVSGMMLANYLDNSKLKVLILERKKKIHIEPETFGTFTKTAKFHGLNKFIDTYFDTWTFYGPTTKSSRKQKNVMCLVNYNKWAQSKKFSKLKLKTGCDLKKAKRIKTGIRLYDQKNKYDARLVVDCSGFAQIVQKLLGIQTNTQTGLSYEVELTGCKFPAIKEASFILNFSVSNSGGWLYITSRTKGQYGWADFYPESKSNLKDLKKRVYDAISTNYPIKKWSKNAKITYEYGRFGPSGRKDHAVYDNLIAIGDAGGLGTPATLEGFREATDSAKMAAKIIKRLHSFSKKDLQEFLDEFYSVYGKYYRMHKLLRYVYLHWVRNADLDRWINNFNKFDRKDFFRLIRGEHTPLLMLRTLDLTLFINLLLNALNSLLPGFLKFRQKISLSKKEVIHARS